MRIFFTHKPAVTTFMLAGLLFFSGCSDAGAGVRKEGAMMSEEDIQAKLAAQKAEIEAMLADKDKAQAQTLENMQKARAEAIELAENNAEKQLAEKVADFEATINALNDELKKEVSATKEEVTAQLVEQGKQIDEINAQPIVQNNDLPYTAIHAKHKDLINNTLTMKQFYFDQVDENGMLTIYPNQVIELVSAIDQNAAALQPYKQDASELLVNMMALHHKEFEESPSTVLIEAKIRRAHIHLWTDQGQVYMAALSRTHPETFTTWLTRLNEEGLFGQPKAVIMQTPEMTTIKVMDAVSALVPLDQHTNKALFSFLKKATVANASAFGFVATPIVGQQVQKQTENLQTYIEANASVQRAQKLNNESFQLVLTDKEDA